MLLSVCLGCHHPLKCPSFPSNFPSKPSSLWKVLFMPHLPCASDWLGTQAISSSEALLYLQPIPFTLDLDGSSLASYRLTLTHLTIDQLLREVETRHTLTGVPSLVCIAMPATPVGAPGNTCRCASVPAAHRMLLAYPQSTHCWY